MFAKRELLALGILVFALSCNQSKNDSNDMLLSEMLSSADTTIPASSAAIEDNGDSSRKFIRTAELKFKVKNVFEATNDIEDVTRRHGGFVTFTNLTSSTDDITTTLISADSSMETTKYTVSNSISIRVPNTHLDTVLKEISRKIDHLDFRIIKADDVALHLLTNSKAIKRNTDAEKRIAKAIDGKGKNLNSIVDAEKTLLDRGREIDDQDISNRVLTDQINFSTVQLSVYQRQTIKVEFLPTEKIIPEYRPGFASQVKDAVVTGWQGLEFLLITVLKIWPLIFIGALFSLFFKRNKMKNALIVPHQKSTV